MVFPSNYSMQFTVVFALLFFTCSFARNPEFAPPSNITDFIEGFAEGLEVEIGNPAVCAKDVNVTEEEFIQGFAKIKDGINHLNIFEVQDGLVLWSQALMGINTALRDCGAEKIANDIEEILKEFSSGPAGILEFVAREILAIIENDVQKLFNQAISAVESGDWKTAGIASGKIVGILLNQSPE